MAKDKTKDKKTEEIKKLLKENKTIIGAKRVIKELRAKRIEKIFLAANCNKATLKTIEHYSKLTDTKIITLNFPNDEFGVICKKPFSISVLGIIR